MQLTSTATQSQCKHALYHQQVFTFWNVHNTPVEDKWYIAVTVHTGVTRGATTPGDTIQRVTPKNTG